MLFAVAFDAAGALMWKWRGGSDGAAFDVVLRTFIQRRCSTSLNLETANGFVSWLH